MKILIDECLPAALAGHLTTLGHECQTVRQAGFGSKKNGELLVLAEGRWDVMLTSDRHIRHQQNYDRAATFDRYPLREIESHERFIAAHASLRSSPALYPSRPGG
jgi:PIN like domain